MVEEGASIAVMGNHEFNAIAYATKGGHGEYLRPHSAKNKRQHKDFLEAYESDREDYDDVIAWFKRLPLWLELDGFRLVHACWDDESIDVIRGKVDVDNCLTDSLLYESTSEGTEKSVAVEILLKGKEIKLPDGASFLDKDDNPRRHIRVQWWNAEARSYRDTFLGPRDVLARIPDDEIGGDHLLEYSPEQPPVLIGHYWMTGDPSPCLTISPVSTTVLQKNRANWSSIDGTANVNYINRILSGFADVND